MNVDLTSLKPDQLVYIKWEDASGCPAGWSDGEEHVHLELANVESVGYVHRISERFVSIVPHTCFGADGEFVSVMGMMSIPFSCILEWHELQLPGAEDADQSNTPGFLHRANESLQQTNEELADQISAATEKLHHSNNQVNQLTAELTLVRSQLDKLKKIAPRGQVPLTSNWITEAKSAYENTYHKVRPDLTIASWLELWPLGQTPYQLYHSNAAPTVVGVIGSIGNGTNA
jgi:hypothetical protein